MYYVYTLWSKVDQKFYIGYTANLKRRMNEHKAGGVYTSARLKYPALIFFEAFLSKRDAQRRERYFKTTKGKRTLRLMLRESVQL
jgi:putative endonuclease